LRENARIERDDKWREDPGKRQPQGSLWGVQWAAQPKSDPFNVQCGQIQRSTQLIVQSNPGKPFIVSARSYLASGEKQSFCRSARQMLQGSQSEQPAGLGRTTNWKQRAEARKICTLRNCLSDRDNKTYQQSSVFGNGATKGSKYLQRRRQPREQRRQTRATSVQQHGLGSARADGVQEAEGGGGRAGSRLSSGTHSRS
jgi:hypothetical protein